MRLILDNKTDVLNGAEPRAWKISKINRINSNGIILTTLAQDLFDQHKDYIEYENPNDPSTIIGMWADYFKDGIIPSDYQEENPRLRLEITHPGKPEIKIGGNYKKFTVTFYDDDDVINHIDGQWFFTIDGKDISSLLSIDRDECDKNQIKIKLNNVDDLIGKVMIVSYESYNGITNNIEITLVGV